MTTMVSFMRLPLVLVHQEVVQDLAEQHLQERRGGRLPVSDVRGQLFGPLSKDGKKERNRVTATCGHLT